MSYTKTVWEDLPSTNTPLNATNLNNIEDGIEDVDLRIEDIDDRVTDNEQDIIQINNMLDMFNDTSGSDWKAMMKNKIDYCIDNINTTKTNAQAFVNGGWSGVNFGFGMFSKIGTTYQLEWFSAGISYYCRKLSNGTYDYHISVESGSNSNGKYIKYADGTMICWNSAQVTKSVSNSWGPLYVCTAFQIGTFPQTFVSTPTINVYCSGSSSVMLVTAAGPSTTSAGSVQLARGDRNTSTTTTVNYVAIGKWK